MRYSIPRDVVLAQLNHQETEQVPYTVSFEPPVEKRLTEHYGTEAWIYSVEPYVYMAGCFDSWNTMRRIGGRQAVDAYGSLWTLTDDIAHVDVPVLENTPYQTYTYPSLESFYSPQKAKVLQRAFQRHKDSFRVCHIGAGPYELSWRLLGMENALIAMCTDEDMYTDILDHTTELLLQFIDQAAALPVDAIMIGDDWCDQRGVMFGAERWRKLFKPRYAKLYARIHKYGFKTINHVCGSVAPLIGDLIEIGLDVLESVQPEAAGMNPFELKKQYGKQLCFWGGLGCQSSVTFSTPDALRKEIATLRSEMARGGGYILAPAKTINDTVSTDNAVAILEEFTGL